MYKIERHKIEKEEKILRKIEQATNNELVKTQQAAMFASFMEQIREEFQLNKQQSNPAKENIITSTKNHDQPSSPKKKKNKSHSPT